MAEQIWGLAVGAGLFLALISGLTLRLQTRVSRSNRGDIQPFNRRQRQ